MLLVDFVLEAAASAALNAGKQYVISAVEKQELSDRINQYLNSQQKYNGVNSIAEEYDFQGIYEYINQNLNEKLVTAVAGTESQRTEARSALYSGAYTAAGAKKPESREKVRLLVSCFIEITRDFFRGKIPMTDRFNAAEIVESINSHTDSAISNLETRLAGNRAESASFQKISELAGSKRYDEIERIAQAEMNMIGASHPLYPNYRFELDARHQMRSVPNSEDAKQKYPPRLVGSGTVLLNGKPVSELSPELYDYADRHQLPITFQISDAKKYLGEFEDPFQHEAEQLIGQEFVRQPTAFDPPLPYSIQIDGGVIVPYIELGLEEIDDDGTHIYSNKAQAAPLIRVRIEMSKNRKKQRVAFYPGEQTNESMLRFRRFIKASLHRAEISFFSLTKNKVFLSGSFLHDLDKDYSLIDQEIDLFERVCEIEKHYGITISLPDNITNGDYHAVWYASELLRGNPVSGRTDSFSFEGILNEEFKERIQHSSGELSSYAFVSTATVHVFNHSLTLPVLREFPNARIDELEKVKQLSELLKTGNSIPFTLVSEEKVYIDRMVTQEQFIQSDNAGSFLLNASPN